MVLLFVLSLLTVSTFGCDASCTACLQNRDFTSGGLTNQKATLHALGWSTFINEECGSGDYAGWCQDASFCGWKPNSQVGWISLNLQGSGQVTVQFRDCHPRPWGTAAVLLDGVTEENFSHSNGYHSVTLDFTDGQTLRLEERDSAVLAVESVTFQCLEQTTTEPTHVTMEPTDVTMEPTDVTMEPTVVTVEPTEATLEPTEATLEPTLATPEPTAPECTWVQNNINTQGERSIGHASSREECIAMVREQCPGATIANMPSSGSGSCWCQFGTDMTFVASSWANCLLCTLDDTCTTTEPTSTTVDATPEPTDATPEPTTMEPTDATMEPMECTWVQNNINTQGERNIGHASSREECITMVRAQCPGATIANMPSSGSGSCWCQFGTDMTFVASSWANCLLCTLDGTCDASTMEPTPVPTEVPSTGPSEGPSALPTRTPSVRPTTMLPTEAPSTDPSFSMPTKVPSCAPTSSRPSQGPSTTPSVRPTTEPTMLPTEIPSTDPSFSMPTKVPSCAPTSLPTTEPTMLPTGIPTTDPSFSVPTYAPTTTRPSQDPSTTPSVRPTAEPTTLPTEIPSIHPSSTPSTTLPTQDPSTSPTTCEPVCQHDFDVQYDDLHMVLEEQALKLQESQAHFEVMRATVFHLCVHVEMLHPGFMDCKDLLDTIPTFG